jgi:hypothetical protein
LIYKIKDDMPRKILTKYHFIYKTTCVLNDKYYVGMHSTTNLKDGYLGSGKRLHYSINKYKKENFKFEILEFCDSRETLEIRESEIVNEDLLKDPLCMNLKPGGKGGIINAEHKQKWVDAGHAASREKKGYIEKQRWLWANDKEWGDAIREKSSAYHKGKGMWSGKHHTEETKELMRNTHRENAHQKGSKNSQFGKCWMYNPLLKESKRVDKVNIQDLAESGWLPGRRMKFET